MFPSVVNSRRKFYGGPAPVTPPPAYTYRLFVLCGVRIYWADDPFTTWNSITTPAGTSWHSVAYDPVYSMWVFGGETGDISTTPDLVTFTPRTNPAASAEIFRTILYVYGALYAATTATGVSHGKIYKSTDGGATWSIVYSPNEQSIFELTYDEVSGRLWAVCESQAMIYTSDGSSWTKVTFAGTVATGGACNGPGEYMFGGNLDRIHVSTDAMATWPVVRSTGANISWVGFGYHTADSRYYGLCTNSSGSALRESFDSGVNWSTVSGFVGIGAGGHTIDDITFFVRNSTGDYGLKIGSSAWVFGDAGSPPSSVNNGRIIKLAA